MNDMKEFQVGLVKSSMKHDLVIVWFILSLQIIYLQNHFGEQNWCKKMANLFHVQNWKPIQNNCQWLVCLLYQKIVWTIGPSFTSKSLLTTDGNYSCNHFTEVGRRNKLSWYFSVLNICILISQTWKPYFEWWNTILLYEKWADEQQKMCRN